MGKEDVMKRNENKHGQRPPAKQSQAAAQGSQHQRNPDSISRPQQNSGQRPNSAAGAGGGRGHDERRRGGRGGGRGGPQV
jgi:uncharacterized sporulation protein YeaH/YhbH (DUF444 family)